MVSHEFRTPLGIIMSAIELIRHYDDRLPPEQRKELQMDIFHSTQHMAGMMEQMLVLGRVEAGKLACQPAPCDLETLAGKLTDECLSATNQKCVIRWRAEGDLSGAMADEALLRHIFNNLIHNAVKYSPPAGEVVFTVRREAAHAVFQVIDHGIGIPQADLKNLFEAFHRGSNVGEIPGTGLGLVIVKRCVDLHDGTLRLDSVVGQGTTLTVELPLFPGCGPPVAAGSGR
jgi:signal transduction histidine kinase